MLRAVVLAACVAAVCSAAPVFAPPASSAGPGMPTDDSLWIAQDSIAIGPPIDSIWRGVCLDPNGIDFWITKGDSWTDIRKRHLVTGSGILYAAGHCPQPYGIIRFADSLCVSSAGSNHFDVYDTLGTWSRTINSPLPALRGVDWDGTRFWATSAESQHVFIMSRNGALLKTLSPTGTPAAGIGVISLDHTNSDRFWLSNGTTRNNNIYYCSFDTNAGAYTIRATFDRPCRGFPAGLAFDGPRPGGSFMYVVDGRAAWLWRVKVHESAIVQEDAGDGPSPTGSVRLRAAGSQPAHGSARLSVFLPAPDHIRLRFFDISGRPVAAPVQGRFPAGVSAITMDLPRVGHGASRVAAGVYLVRMEAGGSAVTAKLVVE